MEDEVWGGPRCAPRAGLLLLICLYLIFAAGYAVLMPAWETPDEPAHYRYVLYIVRNDRLPEYQDTPEAGQPPLYYLLASLPLRLLRQVDPQSIDVYLPPRAPLVEDNAAALRVWDWNDANYRPLPGVLLLRGVNVLIGGLAVYVIFRGARLFFGGRSEPALAASALIGLAPQFLSITASVSNDPLSYLAGAVLFWVLGWLLLNETVPAGILIVLLGAALIPFMVKFTVVPLGLAVLLAGGYRLKDRLRKPAHWQMVAGAGLLALLLAVWFLAGTEMGRGLAFELRYRLLTVRPGILTVTGWLPMLRFPGLFWGKIGWARVDLLFGVVWLLSAFVLVGMVVAFRVVFVMDDRGRAAVFAAIFAAAGLGLLAISLSAHTGVLLLFAAVLIWKWKAPALNRSERIVWGFVWLMVFLAAGAFLRNFMTTPKVQGRFLFPAAGPIMTLVIYGWYEISRRRSGWLLPAVGSVMLAANLWMWFARVIPIFYQPFLD